MTAAGALTARARMDARAWVDVTVPLLLGLVGIVGLATAFDDVGWLRAGVGGLAIGAGAALAARALRFGAVPTVALGLAAYALLGSSLAVPTQAALGVFPTAESLTSLGFGAVWGWSDILTLAPPVELPDYVTVVPYVSAWLVGLVGTTLAARWLPARPRTSWRAALLLAGPMALYLMSVLLGTREPFAPGIRGVAFAAVALIWLGWRRGRADPVATADGVSRGGLLGRRIASTATLVAAAVVLGMLGGSIFATPADRFVLRERFEPPYEALDFPSPLAGFREYSKLLDDETLFTVVGLQPGQRLRLATMDAYDGHVWSVAGSRFTATGSGTFALVGSELPPAPLLTAAGEQRLEVAVGEGYSDVWIPSVGYAETLDLPGSSRTEREGLRYNASTGGAVLLAGLREGDVVLSTAQVQQVEYDDADLAEVPVARVDLAPVTNVPDIVAAKAAEFAGDAESPIDRLRSIELTLQSMGYFSRGTASDTVPSVAGHGADRMTELFTASAMVGDEEQYASAFALMARSLGYPARVVMGFAPELRDGQNTVEVTGHDVTAWVEVAFEGVGWIPFSPTPDRTDVPQDENPKPKTEPQPQVRQPPRSSSEQDGLVTAVEIDDSESDEDDGGLPGWVVPAVLAVLIPSALAFGPMLVLGRLKAARVRRRRTAAEPHEAVRGAWDELVDRFSELGLAVPMNATRQRTARHLTGQLGVADLAPAASRADAAVFGAAAVPDTVVATAWHDTDELARVARASVSARARLLSRYRLSSARAWLAAAAARVDAARSGRAVR